MLYQINQQAKFRLKKGRGLFNSTLMSVGEGIVMAKCPGEILLFNIAAERITGYSQNEVLHRDLDDVFHLIDVQTGASAHERIMDLLRTGQRFENVTDFALMTKDGAEKRIMANIARIKAADGEEDRIIASFRDINKEYELEKQIEGFLNVNIDMISTLPVKVGENRAVFELMKDITDSGILGIEDIDTIEMQKIINSRNRKIISDALTRIHNENYIQDRLPYDIARAKKNNEALSLVYVRIENLKAINDKFGSAAGDFTIRELAKKLKYYSHQDNWVARHGVMGFVLLLHQTGEQAGYQICKRIFD